MNGARAAFGWTVLSLGQRFLKVALRHTARVSQADRIEPIFKDAPWSALVPQIEILYGNRKAITLLEAGHRLGDAIIHCVGKDKANRACCGATASTPVRAATIAGGV